MISSITLFPPSPSFPSGKQNPQPDGSFTLDTTDNPNSDVFSIQGGKLGAAPFGSATENEKMWLDPGGGSVSLHAKDGLTYCYQYDGRRN